ncbi:PAS domain-containing protein [Spirosoma sp. KUDC1026]|uniref:PAS domain-containing protein n=1 Tax=Spirosoma sp. KUDC1026 TaxID=2745947 RepID=UPI00159BCF1A|nr:PAS domain-containing protein [Spirosoma sp. KUDC1026]QKZ12851.1 PAS domain-containing protein [Spirosoma sp. KUDC1026]
MTGLDDRLLANERFELLAKATRDAVWDWNLETDTVWWNEGFFDLFGYGLEELEPGPESWYNRIHPDDQDETLHSIHETIDGGGTNWSHEYRFRRADGSYAMIFDRGYIIHREGKPVRMVGSMQDVSTYRELLRRQQESEERYRMAMEATKLGTWDYNPVTEELRWDDRCRALFGLSPGRPVSWSTFEEGVHPDDRSFTTAAVQRAVDPAIRSYYNIEYRTIGKEDDLIRWVRATGQGYFSPEGIAYRFVGTIQDITADKAKDNALRASQERLRLVIEQAPVAMLVFRGDDLTFETVNSTMLAMLGKTADIIGKPLLEGLPEMKGQAIVDTMYRVYHTGEPYYGWEVPVTLVRNGQTEDCYFNVAYTPIREKDTITGIIEVATEVTQQVTARKALEESEQRFRTLIAEAPFAIGVYVTDDIVIDNANPVLLNMWSKDSSVIGKPMEEAIPELKGQPFVQLLKDVYRTGVTYQTTEQHADLLDGDELKPFWFNFTYKPLKDANGHVYAILHMAVDVTAQVVARQQLKQAQESLATAIDVAGLGTWQLYLQTNESFFSDRIREWAGFDIDESITLADVLACVPNNERVVDAVEKATLPGGDGRLAVEYHLINRKTGQERIISSQGQTFFTETGTAQTIVGASYDITLQRGTEQELSRLVSQRTHELELANYDLQRSNANLQQFAYVASHDLQEPLRKVQSFSSLLQDQYAQEIDERGRDILGRIQQAGERMSTLIRDLLNYSRISTRQQTFEPVSLQTILNDVIDTLDLRIQQTGAAVNASKLPTVRGDESQLRQLFQNLLSNAMKFSLPDRPPVINITTTEVSAQNAPAQLGRMSQVPAFIRIDVADNGIGFDQKYADRIFQVFQRLHTHSQYAGTGVGLAICQRVAENHGGAITATSQPGQGTTFSIYLPK